ncbi:MAG: hypothetical protein JW704_04715 [Anaerolineaceae bacterium]|nr:hypothetical protein [Anaerolineaceae bacterium]
MLFFLIGLVYPAGALSALWYADSVFPNYFILGLLILIGSLCFYGVVKNVSMPIAIAFTAILYSVIARVAIYLPEISTQMTSMGWSEASRYYYASLFFSHSVYGASAPLPVLHPSRYLLQSIPFIIPNMPIWVHRAWQVLLWIVLPVLGSALIARRVKIKSNILMVIMTGWGYLFLLQVPVYYHLMICVIVVAAGFSAQKPFRSLIVVFVASIWAGISRLNWFPVPGLLAVLFYVLEIPRADKHFWRYWLWPAIWAFFGLVVAFLSERAYIMLSGNPADHYGTSMTSSLLWYRLFPNVTYTNGVLISILIVSLPAILLILTKLVRSRGIIHIERIMAISVLLLVFFVGGLIVSVKIGGGSNLHNLDAFLIFLFITMVYLLHDRVKIETASTNKWRSASWILVVILLALPMMLASQTTSQFTRFDNGPVKKDLATLQGVVDATPQSEGEILFISQRHFVTFHYIDRVELVSDYEKVFLMEMAMAGHEPFLQQFEQDLKSHRFSLIIAESLSMIIQDEEDVFFEENNAWTIHITSLIRKYYQEAADLPDALIVVLEPIPSSESRK